MFLSAEQTIPVKANSDNVEPQRYEKILNILLIQTVNPKVNKKIGGWKVLIWHIFIKSSKEKYNFVSLRWLSCFGPHFLQDKRRPRKVHFRPPGILVFVEMAAPITRINSLLRGSFGT